MHIHNIHKNVTAMYSSVHSISDLLFFIEMQPFDSNAIFLFIRFALSTNIKFRGLILPHFQYYGFKCFLTYQNKYLYKIHFLGALTSTDFTAMILIPLIMLSVVCF